MATVKVGATDIKKVYVGTTEAKKVYLGSTQVWASGFDPKSISGLTVWLDASDTALTALEWPDKSGLGHHGTFVGNLPAPIPDPPVRGGTLLNGLPTVRFSANKGRVRGTGMCVDGSWDLTVLYVGRMVGPNVGRIFTNTYPPFNFLVGTHTSGEPVMYDNGWVGNTPPWVPLPYPWAMYGAVCRISPAVLSSFYKNGELQATAGTSVGHGQYWNLSGYDATREQETCDCEVAELLIWDKPLTDPERVQVETYLKAKWGLT